MRGGSDVVVLTLNCKITERLVPIDPRFKNRRLPTTSQKQSRGSLERHFALVRTIQAENNCPNLPFLPSRFQTKTEAGRSLIIESHFIHHNSLLTYELEEKIYTDNWYPVQLQEKQNIASFLDLLGHKQLCK